MLSNIIFSFDSVEFDPAPERSAEEQKDILEQMKEIISDDLLLEQLDELGRIAEIEFLNGSFIDKLTYVNMNGFGFIDFVILKLQSEKEYCYPDVPAELFNEFSVGAYNGGQIMKELDSYALKQL